MGRGGYATTEFWDEWYLEAEHAGGYDWLLSFEDVAPFLEALVGRHEARILVVGCGNSDLSAELFARGYRRLVSVDNCASVIAAQRDRHPMLDWRAADVRRLPFGDGAFDVVLDKGLIDNLRCYADADRAVAAFRREARRVLAAPGGRLVAFSCHGRAETEAAVRAPGLWSAAVLPTRNPRWPAIDIEWYHVALCVVGGADAAAPLAAALAAANADVPGAAPTRLARLDARASGRRHSALIAAAGGGTPGRVEHGSEAPARPDLTPWTVAEPNSSAGSGDRP